MDINSDELRIMIEGKEVYPRREKMIKLKKDCVINLRLRLLGGGQDEMSWEKKSKVE